jgi:hypothetical protein
MLFFFKTKQILKRRGHTTFTTQRRHTQFKNFKTWQCMFLFLTVGQTPLVTMLWTSVAKLGRSWNSWSLEIISSSLATELTEKWIVCIFCGDYLVQGRSASSGCCCCLCFTCNSIHECWSWDWGRSACSMSVHRIHSQDRLSLHRCLPSALSVFWRRRLILDVPAFAPPNIYGFWCSCKSCGKLVWLYIHCVCNVVLWMILHGLCLRHLAPV